MILVGPSLGAAVAIDFAVSHPEAVSDLELKFILKEIPSNASNRVVIISIFNVP